jgi:hypothetical protein
MHRIILALLSTLLFVQGSIDKTVIQLGEIKHLFEYIRKI